MEGMSKEVKPRMKKGFWKPEEDFILKKYVETHGEGNWTIVSNKSGLMRGAKSCRLRWKNYLRPNIKHGMMSEDEKDLIVRLHKLLGNRWSLIAGRLPGRTDNEVKNYWNTHLNKTKSSATTTTTTTTAHHHRRKKRDLSALATSHQQQVEVERKTDNSSTVVDHHSWVDRCDDEYDDQNLIKSIEDQDYVNNYGLIDNLQYLPPFDHFNYEEEAFMMMSLFETRNNSVMPTFGIGSCSPDHEIFMSDQTPFFF